MNKNYQQQSRFRVVLSFLLFVSPAAAAQVNPQALVSKLVENELKSQKHPRYWMYVDTESKPGRTEISKVVQMPDAG
jgi:hypothetical protein